MGRDTSKIRRPTGTRLLQSDLAKAFCLCQVLLKQVTPALIDQGMSFTIFARPTLPNIFNGQYRRLDQESIR